jgi:hypothetical protein
MTFTSDPPVVGDITLIPGVDEKADLDAPAGSGGKLVIGQAPNITITETTVVADAAERLALDVQEGDIAIQTNTSQSFIFTGGPNLAPNWQVIQFDAVGGIQGEDIDPRDVTPRDVTASGDVSGQNLTIAAAFNGADVSAASAGESLTADGNGNLTFQEIGGDSIISGPNFQNFEKFTDEVFGRGSNAQPNDVEPIGVNKTIVAADLSIRLDGFRPSSSEYNCTINFGSGSFTTNGSNLPITFPAITNVVSIEIDAITSEQGTGQLFLKGIEIT